MIRVLHVDDEAPIRLLVRVNLEAEGMEVIEAANGRSGVQLAKRERPDLILLGVMMPVLDGWEAAEELRKDQETREIPVVFLTAQSRLKDQARGLDLGAVDYILKPFNPLELAPRVRGVLERLERGERDEVRREALGAARAQGHRGSLGRVPDCLTRRSACSSPARTAAESRSSHTSATARRPRAGTGLGLSRC